ncbi:MAG: carboxymuconolactone decarboxylase family protein [Haloarculaceae archaeon]
MARLPYVTGDELPERHRPLLGSYSEMGAEYTPHVTSPPEREDGDDGSDVPPRLYQAMANNPPILEAFRRMASTLRAGCGLSERHREVVILASARATGAEYEWHHHVRIGRAVGLSVEEIRAIAEGRPGAFDAPEAALIGYTTRLVEGTVDDATHEALVAQFDEREAVGVAMVAQFYLGLSRVIEAFDLDIGEPFVGWELERLET